jgi:CHAD domain-containing protein
MMNQASDDSTNMPAEPFQTGASTMIGTGLSAFVQSQLQAAQRQLARKGLSRHKGIHEARKCIRRAKAALAIGHPAFGERGVRLNAGLGRICRGLSPLRDAQALIEVLQSLHAGATDALQKILPAAESAARQRRDRSLAKALACDPQFKRRCQRLQRLSENLRRLDWDRVGEDCVAEAIRRSERRLEKAGKRVRKSAEDNESWHEYRRRLRRLRQQDTLLSGLDVESGLLNREFRAQADALGSAQDDVLLIRRCGKDSPFRPEHRRLLRRTARQRLYNARGSWIQLH